MRRVLDLVEGRVIMMMSASTALVRWAFDALALHRVHAHHMVDNPASGRVLEKVGFRCEGLLRRHIRKWDELHDVVLWGILRGDLPA